MREKLLHTQRILAALTTSDYALLLIHRYREELCRHAATEDAMAVALRRTLPTLLASSATVGTKAQWGISVEFRLVFT